jgi:1-acyl-sn-glycerol-3-phosphate acyltransferase
VDTASVKAALRHLSAGKCLGIFPQGGIRNPAEPFEVRDGVGLLALRSGATVIPAYIDGIKYSEGVIAPLIRRQHARVRFGKPVDLSEFKGREKDRDAYREASQKIADAIIAIRDSEPTT